MDNLKQLTLDVDTAIPIGGGVGSVKTVNHNPLEKSIIGKVGKKTGFPFLAKRNPVDGIIPAGEMFWNGNVMNETEFFEITLSQTTLDGNSIQYILDLLLPKSIIHFKDHVGRATLLEYYGKVAGFDGEGNGYFTLTVKGFSEHTDYGYQVDEAEECMLEFTPITKDSALMFQGSGIPTGNVDLEEWTNMNLGFQMFYYDNENLQLYVFDYGSSDWVKVNREPYTVYRCQISQTGTDDPIVNEQQNDTGATINFTYSGIGVYKTILPFDITKLHLLFNGGALANNASTHIVAYVYDDGGDITLEIATKDSGVSTDDLLLNANIELKVFS